MTEVPESGSLDRLLDLLVRKTMNQHDQNTDRPDDDTLLRYLTGEATEQERRDVRQALDRSNSLRRQLAEMAADIEALSDRETMKRFDAVTVDRIPSRKKFLGEHEQTFSEFLLSFMHSLRVAFAKPALAYALVLLAAGVAGYQFIQRSDGIQVGPAEQLELHLLPGSSPLRGDEAEVPQWKASEPSEVLVLRLLLPPDAANETELTVTLASGARETIRVESVPVTGDHLLMVIPREDLRPGYHTLTVTGAWQGRAGFFVQP